MSSLRNRIYYFIKPVLPRRLQLFIRRTHIRIVAHRYSHVWPIDPDSGAEPEGWPGWPHGKRFAFVLTHDVDTMEGYRHIRELAELEMKRGLRSSFNFLARRYEIDKEDFHYLSSAGFEIGVHGVYHDGKKFDSYKIFQERARIINQCIDDWGAVGFRAPSMQHNLDWIGDLNIEYDASTFDTDPFEPQSDGVGTIFPFWVEKHTDGCLAKSGYVELPYTLPQDFTPFILMRVKSNDLWKKKIEWIAKRGGMVLINTHPDYMQFDGCRPGLEKYPVRFYAELLDHVRKEYGGQYWHALPRDVAGYVRGLREENIQQHADLKGHSIEPESRLSTRN